MTALLNCSIESLCLRVTSGGTPSRAVERYWSNGTIPWFKTGELKDGWLEDSEEKITEEALENSSAKVFPANTVLMAMYGDGKTITSLGILKSPATTNQACCAMIVDADRCDYRFLFYKLKGVRHALLKLVVAGAQRNLSAGIIKGFQLDVPAVGKQALIADALSTYDHLIENNRRRIALLEESARLLYREWFIHLRYPGHEHVKVFDGVPDGWERLPASDAFYINPSTPRTDDGELTYVPMASISEVGMLIDKAAFERRQDSTSVRFQDGDTLFARITPCLENGKTGYVQFLSFGEVACGSTEFIVLRGRRVSSYFVYLTARQADFRENAIKSMIGSSGRQRVQPSCFDRYSVLVPPDHLATLFDESAASLFKQIRTLDQQSQRLADARDILLPRLMSGEIAV